MLPLFLMLAQAFSFQEGGRPQRAPQALALVDRARSLPPEFCADTLLRLAESSLVTQPSRKQELVEEAYWSGAHASLPYLQRADGRSDSVATNAVRANGLEALTLQTRQYEKCYRSIQGMRFGCLNRSKEWHYLNSAARQRQLRTLLPIMRPEDSFSRLHSQTKQRANGDDSALLSQLVGSVETPAQVPPALEMILSVVKEQDQRLDLVSLLAAKLQQISRSDREYSAAEPALVSALASGRMRPSEAVVFVPALRPISCDTLTAFGVQTTYPPVDCCRDQQISSMVWWPNLIPQDHIIKQFQ